MIFTNLSILIIFVIFFIIILNYKLILGDSQGSWRCNVIHVKLRSLHAQVHISKIYTQLFEFGFEI